MREAGIPARRGALAGAGRKALVLMLLTAAAGIFTFPFLWSLSISLQPSGDVFRWPIRIIPDPLTFDNYRRLWTEMPFARWFLNSAFVASAVTAANLFLDALAGYVFARLRFPGRNTLFALLLGTLMVPAHVTLIPKFMLVNALGLVNTYAALIAPAMVQVVGIFLMRQFYESVPRQLDEAALIDGCTRFQVFWKVLLPLSRPALAALGIYSFQGNWNEFLWPLVVSISGDRFTLPVGLAMFRSEHKVEWTLLMAGSLLIALPTLAVFLAFQRLFVQGAVTSGLKE
jgi:multiple sugar transport system permease protein